MSLDCGRRKPTHAQEEPANSERPELGFKFQTFLLWGNSVYHRAAVSSESIQIKRSSFSLNGWSASLCQSISRTSSLHVPTKRFGAQSLHFSVSTLLKNKNVPLKENLAGESLWNSFITLGMNSSHLSSICSPNTWQEGSLVKTRKDQGFHPTVNIPSNSAVMRFKTDAETDGFTSSSPWKHFESPVGSFLPFGHLVFYLLWLFLATTAAAVRNKSEEGWEARALDRREAERLQRPAGRGGELCCCRAR